MSSVKVFLNNYNNACYPGQTIAGRVECNFHETKNVRAVRVKFWGGAETEWILSEGYYDYTYKAQKTRDVTYSAEENYFNVEHNLLQGEMLQLPSGRHSYPFSYILPAQLPSSIEGKSGNIRYYIKATVDCPSQYDYENFFAWEDKFMLNVVSPLDLNYLPGLRDPVNSSVDKTMCSCWCNDTGALTFNLSLPATGFVPGQEVSIGAYVQNMTNVNVENVLFWIVKDIEFLAHQPDDARSFDTTEVTRCIEGGIGAHGEKSWTSTLTIPLEQFPNLIHCSIINVRYTLKAELVVKSPHSNLADRVAVMIGTVPLSGITTTFPGGPPPEIPSMSVPPARPLLPSDGSALPCYSDANFAVNNSSYLPGPANGYRDTENPSSGSTAPYRATDSNFEHPSYHEAKQQLKGNRRESE